MEMSQCTRAKCRSCPAWVVWVRMPSGKMNPIDPAHSADGNVVLTAATDQDGNPVGRVLTNAEQARYAGPRHKSHFSTCPNANEWRRRR